MGDWLLLPTELWCQVIDHIQCVFDRTELSLTCSRLHAVVLTVTTPPGTHMSQPNLIVCMFLWSLRFYLKKLEMLIGPFSASLPAFRSYHDRLTYLDHHLMQKNVTRSKRRRICPQKTLSWAALISMKEHVTKDLKAGDGYEPHFLELVLKWIDVTKPATRVVQTVWKTVALSNSNSYSMFSYRLALDFRNIIESTSYYAGIRLREPERPWFFIALPENGIIYKHKSYLAEIDLPIEIFERVNQNGHCVIDLPLVESQKRRCTEYNIFEHACLLFCTLTLESGYYVVRRSTLEELHGQSIQDCQNYPEACFFERRLIMISPSSKLLPAKLDTSLYMLPAPHNRFVSLLYNKKEVIDDVLSEISFAWAVRLDVTMLVIVEPWEPYEI